jgi:2-methylisocitrate lyase-like PEP mutase family enzyme
MSKPINVIMSRADRSIATAQLAAMGVKRICVDGSVDRYAMAGLLKAGRQ